MCMKNITALGVIILFLSAFIGQSQGGKRKLKHAKSVSYETEDTSSDSEEDKRPNVKDLAAKIILNSEDTEESRNDEKIIINGHKNVDMAHKDFAKKHYLILKSGTKSSKEDEIIREGIDKIMNEGVATNHKKFATKNILNPKDDIESSREKIIKSNSNEDVVQTHEVSAALTHMNLEDRKESSREEEVIRGNPKIKFNERVSSKHKDLAEKTDIHFEETKESIREDEIVRGDIKSKFNERVPSKHVDLAAETHSNLEDTQEPIRKDEIVRGDSKIKFNAPSKHKDLAGRPDLNLDIKESIREDEIEKADTKIELNIRDDAIKLREKDEIVKVNDEKTEIPGVDEKVLTIHLTNQNKHHKPILRQWTPPPIIIRAQEKISNSKNPASNESSLDDDAMQRDIKKVKALRKAYGDACLGVIVRKCLKVMKSTLKEICKSGGRKCKREFNDDFKENSITGCNMQFNNKSTYRVENESSIMETGATRTLSMTCLRTLSDTAEESETAFKSEIVDAETKNVNILRDKYEKACQKQSYGKCLAAGKYANDTTCAKYECTNTKKKAIKKTYKKYCGNYYGYVKPDSSSSRSSSSSSSGSSASSD